MIEIVENYVRIIVFEFTNFFPEAINYFYKLIHETAKTSKPIRISGKRTNVILMSEDDWKAIQETLYIVSITGMRESIIIGMKTFIDRCADKLVW